jgi:putative drug exporter of the RND superfamily
VQMSGFLHRLARWCYAHRWVVVTIWLALLVVAVVGARVGNGTLDRAFSVPGTPSQVALNQVKEDFPASAGVSAQLVFRATGGTAVTSPANAAAIQRVLAQAAKQAQVAQVVSPSASRQITPNGQAAIGTVDFSVTAGNLDQSTLTKLTGIANAAGTRTLTVRAGGQAYSSSSVSTGISDVIGLVFAFIILSIALAAMSAAGAPLITAIGGVLIAMMGIKGLAAVTQISPTAQTLAVMIGLAVGIDYSLFILIRHRAQLATGMAPAESAALAVGTAGTAVVFAGCTVFIALAALSVVGIPFLTTMGLSAACTVVIAVLIATTLLPAILGLWGRRMTPKPGSRAARLALRAAHVGQPVVADRKRLRPTMGARWLNGIVRRPVLALASALVVLLAIAAPALKLSLALPDSGYQAPGTSQRIAFDTVSQEFGPGFNGPLLVVASLGHSVSNAAATAEANAVAHVLGHYPGVVAVAAPHIDAAGTTALITAIPSTAPAAKATTSLVTSIRNDAPSILRSTGAQIAVTGTTAVNIDVSSKLSSALVPFGAIVVGLSLLLLMLVFRSFLIPVKAAAGFLLSVAAASGATVAVFQWGWLGNLIGVPKDGPVVSFLPIILIAVLFGLAMDYEVFLASRIREDYVHRGDPRRAIVTGGGAASRVVVAAAIIMTGIFASFIIPSDPVIKPIAFSLAIGVACDALLVRMTAVPAFLALAGRGAWYLPRWLHRALPNLDVEGAALERHEPASAPVSAA